jgi:hypothetical protein
VLDLLCVCLLRTACALCACCVVCTWMCVRMCVVRVGVNGCVFVLVCVLRMCVACVACV